MENSFEFINKVWLPLRGKRKGVRMLFFVLGGLLLLITLFQIAMEGLGAVNYLTGLGLPALMIVIGLMNNGRGGYTQSVCTLTVTPAGVTVYYPGMNREDGKGVYRELVELPKECILSAQYSESVASVRLLSKGIVTRTGENGASQAADYRKGNATLETVLYPPADQVQPILDALLTMLRISVERLA